jgi:hypothetical protein
MSKNIKPEPDVTIIFGSSNERSAKNSGSSSGINDKDVDSGSGKPIGVLDNEGFQVISSPGRWESFITLINNLFKVIK